MCLYILPCRENKSCNMFCFLYFRSSVRIGEYDTSTDPDCSASGFCAPTVINHGMVYVISCIYCQESNTERIIHFIIIVISHVVIHPDYVNGQYHHDIALIVLKTPLNYTGEIGHINYYLFINKCIEFKSLVTNKTLHSVVAAIFGFIQFFPLASLP